LRRLAGVLDRLFSRIAGAGKRSALVVKGYQPIVQVKEEARHLVANEERPTKLLLLIDRDPLFINGSTETLFSVSFSISSRELSVKALN
jgi:hypothetical protein